MWEIEVRDVTTAKTVMFFGGRLRLGNGLESKSDFGTAADGALACQRSPGGPAVRGNGPSARREAQGAMNMNEHWAERVQPGQSAGGRTTLASLAALRIKHRDRPTKAGLGATPIRLP